MTMCGLPSLASGSPCRGQTSRNDSNCLCASAAESVVPHTKENERIAACCYSYLQCKTLTGSEDAPWTNTLDLNRHACEKNVNPNTCQKHEK